MSNGFIWRRRTREDSGVTAAHDDESTDEELFHGYQALPDLKRESCQAFDHRASCTSHSESFSGQAQAPGGVESSSKNIDTVSVTQEPELRFPRDCSSVAQPITSDHPEEGLFGVKRLHSPTFVFKHQPAYVSGSTGRVHGIPQGTNIDWIQECDMRFISPGANHMEFLSPGMNPKDVEAEEVRHCKRSRRAQTSVIFPTAESRRLEEELTCNLLRRNGKAGDEIPEQFLDPNAIRPGLYNSLLARFGLDLNAMADLQNLLDFVDQGFVGPSMRERSEGSIIQATAVQRLARSLSSSHPSDPASLSTSYLPPSLPLGSKSIIYLSEVLPRSFDRRKRSELLGIFHTKASYVPACISLASGLPYGIQYHVRRFPGSDVPQTNLPLSPNGRGWPCNVLPLEVFHIISNHLPRDALKNMRLVNREFESKISNAIFHTVVVPFRPEIYGMMVQQSRPRDPMVIDVKGKGRELPREPEKRVHDGMRTFQGWGPHIKKFAMAFEVEETTLEKPPPKGRFETHGTFWGRYKWPHPNYNRYEYCEDLEKKADEFRCMSAALSNLTGVIELGLSIDSGLGWLNGPDISDRAQLLREKPRIFGKSQQILDTLTQQRREEWNAEMASILGSPTQPGLPERNGFYKATIFWPLPVTSGASRGPIFDKIPDRSVSSENTTRPLMFEGVDIRRLPAAPTNEERPQNNKLSRFSKAPLTPNCLSSSQQEWLLEIEWAQRAFISSFCMALSDNSQAFSRVTTLNIARISSRHLPSLQRRDFWDALQNLNNLTIYVSADWRNILKTATGSVEAPPVKPSIAASQFFDLLKTHVSGMKNVKALEIGYAGGGEHQTGIYGRNKNILPAPLVDYSKLMSSNWTTSGDNESSSANNMVKDLLVMKHVEKLTLTNCWFPPLTFKIFCTRMRREKLKTLTLKSVSLCFQSSLRSSLQAQNTEPCVSSVPQGPPRYGDPSVADFFDLRPGDIKDPQPDGWIRTPQRIGSWGQVIDFVTPGANLDFVRYAYQYYDKEYFDSLKRPDPQALESIIFESCGYVHLPNFREFPQTLLNHDQHTMPAYLTKRAADLAHVSMDGSSDKLLGEIVTSFPPKETEVFETGFPMIFGWEDRAKAADCLEDGQPLGGSGRFSGKVQRLTYPTIEDHEAA